MRHPKNKYERQQTRKRKYKRILRFTQGGYHYKQINWRVDISKEYWGAWVSGNHNYTYENRLRGATNSNQKQFLKKECNQAIRRYKGDIKNGYHCRKIKDYWRILL